MEKNLLFFIHGIGSNKKTWKQLIQLMENDLNIQIKEHKFRDTNNDCNYFYKLDEYNAPIKNLTWNPCTWFNFKICDFMRIKKSGELKAGDLLVADHADVLITKLNLLSKSYENIYLIGHSMGGLVILESLFELFFSSNDNLLPRIKKVIFIASPFAGSDDSKDIKRIFEKRPSKHIFSCVVKELSPDSQTIVNIENGIGKYKNELQDLNCLFMNGKTDARILSDSAEFAQSFCQVENFLVNHTKIKEPMNTKDPLYEVFFNFIFTISNSKLEESIKGVEDVWYKNKEAQQSHANYIVLSSEYTNTLYASGIFIAHHKYHIKMMEDGQFDKFFHRIIPFDKEIKFDPKDNSMKEDEYYKNTPGNRFEGKAYKIIHYPKDLPIESKKPIYSYDGNRGWIKFRFTSQPIPKNTDFFIEISISDKIDLTNPTRINEYFESTIDNEKNPHALRQVKYQIETYTDSSEGKINLPFMPWATVGTNASPLLNDNNCSENIYYKTWNWKLYFSESNPHGIKIDLISKDEYKKNGPPCG